MQLLGSQLWRKETAAFPLDSASWEFCSWLPSRGLSPFLTPSASLLLFRGPTQFPPESLFIPSMPGPPREHTPTSNAPLEEEERRNLYGDSWGVQAARRWQLRRNGSSRYAVKSIGCFLPPLQVAQLGTNSSHSPSLYKGSSWKIVVVFIVILKEGIPRLHLLQTFREGMTAVQSSLKLDEFLVKIQCLSVFTSPSNKQV